MVDSRYLYARCCIFDHRGGRDDGQILAGAEPFFLGPLVVDIPRDPARILHAVCVSGDGGEWPQREEGRSEPNRAGRPTCFMLVSMIFSVPRMEY